ncbi:MAG TPA: hypothetical protein VFQ40_03490 [Actinomycetota bacterium]|nr:hypothetical protein [Actinomycetota bacterium]
MIASITSRIPQRTIVAIDLVVLTWTIVWIVLGITVGTFVARLGVVGDGLQDAGRAIGRAGDAVDRLSDVPLVGEGFAAVATEVRDVGRETVADGRTVRDDIDRLAWLIGISLGLAPTLPVLAAWVPPRVARERERRALRRSLRSDDPVALGYLANRALASRGFRELTAVSDDPLGDLRAGRYRGLASLELDHLGLQRRRRPLARPVGRTPRTGRSLAERDRG